MADGHLTSAPNPATQYALTLAVTLPNHRANFNRRTKRKSKPTHHPEFWTSQQNKIGLYNKAYRNFYAQLCSVKFLDNGK